MNKVAGYHAGREMPGFGAYGVIRLLQKAGRVPDAGGSMAADARTRADHFASGRMSPVEPEWLTVEQMRVIAGVKAMQARYF